MSLHLNEYWLEFDGVDDYVQAQNVSDLDFALPIKVKFKHLTNNTYRPIVKSEQSGNNNRYWIIYDSGSFGLRTSAKNYDVAVSFNIGQTYEYEVYLDGSDVVQKIDGVEISRTSAGSLPNASGFTFRLAAYETTSGDPTSWTENEIYSFQIGTETFSMNEGTGTTITGSEGTVLDIYGATWGGSPTKQINEVYIEDSGVLRPVKNIYLGTSTGLKNIYQSEPTP